MEKESESESGENETDTNLSMDGVFSCDYSKAQFGK